MLIILIRLNFEIHGVYEISNLIFLCIIHLIIPKVLLHLCKQQCFSLRSDFSYFMSMNIFIVSSMNKVLDLRLLIHLVFLKLCLNCRVKRFPLNTMKEILIRLMSSHPLNLPSLIIFYH